MQKKRRKHKCAMCGKSISGGFAYFYCGAIVDQFLLKRKNLNASVIEAFCNVGYHGALSDMSDSADYCIADSAPGGQIERFFCSVSCVRGWFDSICDTLEKELIGKGSSKRLSKSRRGS